MNAGMVSKVAVRAILRNKTRAMLTCLGIIVGIAAVIAVMAIGQGAQTMMVKEISSMGDNLLMVFPERRGHGAQNARQVGGRERQQIFPSHGGERGKKHKHKDRHDRHEKEPRRPRGRAQRQKRGEQRGKEHRQDKKGGRRVRIDRDEKAVRPGAQHESGIHAKPKRQRKQRHPPRTPRRGAHDKLAEPLSLAPPFGKTPEQPQIECGGRKGQQGREPDPLPRPGGRRGRKQPQRRR